MIQHLYWHNDELKKQTVSDSSEDIPILSSGEECVREIHSSMICGAQFLGSGPMKELTVNEFICVYGNAFMAANHKYVDDFLTELHQRKYVFENSSDVKEERLQVMTFSALNKNSDKTIA